MREQWPGKMAEYKSCCSKQSFSGLTITVLLRTNKQSFSGLPNIPKTINQLCLLQTDKQWPGKMAEYKSCCSKQSFSGLTITVLFRTNKQSFSGLPNIPKTINQLCLLQTDKPHAKHNLYRRTNRQTPCQT